MARKLNTEEATVFGQELNASDNDSAFVEDDKLLETLRRQRQQPLELSRELQIWFEQSTRFKTG